MKNVEKLCIYCGNDCVGHKRMRDRRGRYAHQSCLEQHRQAVKQRSLVIAGGESATDFNSTHEQGFSIDDFVGKVEVPAAIPCPDCGQPREAHAVVCLKCGYNQSSGRTITTKTKDEKIRRVKSRGDMGGRVHSTVSVFVGWLLALAGLAALFGLPAIAWHDPQLARPIFMFAAGWYAVSYISMIVFAVLDGESGWGLMGIGAVIPIIGGICCLYFTWGYCFNESSRQNWKLNYWFAFGTALIMSIVIWF